MPLQPSSVPEPDPSRVSPARRYDSLLGGKDNYQADRRSAAQLTEALPSLPLAIAELRRCLERQVQYLAGRGVRQFLDLGCGFPHPPNVHEIAQRADPTSRIVYVDSDKEVGTHARALMVGTTEGRVQFVLGDLADIDTILKDTLLRATLDFRQPVAVLMAAVLHFIPDDKAATNAVNRVKATLAPGSYLAITHMTVDPLPAATATALNQLAESGEHGPGRARTLAEVEGYFDGLQLVDPGVVPTVLWRPEMDPKPQALIEEAIAYAGVGRTGS